MKLLIAVWFLTAFNLFATDGTYKLRFTRTDNSIYQCGFAYPWPEYPTYLGDNGGPIGSHTNVYASHSYTIDAATDTLLRDGVAVGQTVWDGVGVWDVQPRYGFCIDKDGVGWLATMDEDWNNVSFLLRVDLSTGHVTYVDFIEGENMFEINGMIVYKIQLEF